MTIELTFVGILLAIGLYCLIAWQWEIHRQARNWQAMTKLCGGEEAVHNIMRMLVEDDEYLKRQQLDKDVKELG